MIIIVVEVLMYDDDYGDGDDDYNAIDEKLQGL